MQTPVYPGIWLNRSKPHLGYRVMPKCGCSSVGQIMHYLDHGTFYAGSIHDLEAPLLKWKTERDGLIEEIFATQPVFRFTLVRNPYKRLLSSFADKVFGFQANGKRYRGGAVLEAVSAYGADWGPKADLVANFKAFVRFVADTIEKGEPMPSDLHWTPCFQHLRFTATRAPEWSLDFVGHVENFKRDMETVLSRAGVDPGRLPPNTPRENTTSLPDIPITTFYELDEVEIMHRVYQRDFNLFKYSRDPLVTKPIGEIDVEEVNAALRQAVERVQGVNLVNG